MSDCHRCGSAQEQYGDDDVTSYLDWPLGKGGLVHPVLRIAGIYIKDLRRTGSDQSAIRVTLVRIGDLADIRGTNVATAAWPDEVVAVPLPGHRHSVGSQGVVGPVRHNGIGQEGAGESELNQDREHHRTVKEMGPPELHDEELLPIRGVRPVCDTEAGRSRRSSRAGRLDGWPLLGPAEGPAGVLDNGAGNRFGRIPHGQVPEPVEAYPVCIRQQPPHAGVVVRPAQQSVLGPVHDSDRAVDGPEVTKRLAGPNEAEHVVDDRAPACPLKHGHRTGGRHLAAVSHHVAQSDPS